MNSTPITDFEFLGECFLRDMNIEKRQDANTHIDKEIAKAVRILASNAKRINVVYTAFDGDHFHFLPNMRQAVFAHNKIPANPESILGYKNVVTRYQTKLGVLIDDLAILQGCDELWVFTDYDATLEDAAKLPEGVLIELAFYLKRRSKPTVYFASLSSLAETKGVSLKKCIISFEELEKKLVDTDRSEIIDLANNNFRIDADLKNLVYFITDPLDFKYSEWLRDHNSVGADEIGLIPGLALPVSDLGPGVNNIGTIILTWAVLLRRLSRKRAYYVDSFDNKRNKSIIAETLKRFCILDKGQEYIKEKKWSSFNIPKNVQKNRWPITKFEAKQI